MQRNTKFHTTESFKLYLFIALDRTNELIITLKSDHNYMVYL